MTSVTFIVIILVVSGFIAWAGDVLGRVLGKKRVALFGLRPRRAAVVITIITGILITALTIFAMTLMSETFRRMILEFDTVLTEMSELTDERDQLATERDFYINERDSARMERDLERETHAAEIRENLVVLSTVKTELISYRADISELTSDIGNLTTEYDELVEESETVKSEMEAQIAEKVAELDVLENRMSGLSTQIVNMTAERDVLRQEAASLASQITDLSSQIEFLREQVQSYISGTIKVFEGQQLIVIPIDTRLDGTTIYEIMRGTVNRIPETFMDPISGEYLLADNSMEVEVELYSYALEDIRQLNTENALVIVYATENVVEEMPVRVRFEVTRNFRVYAQGSTIYSDVFMELDNVADPYRAVLARFFEGAKNYIVNERRIIPYTSGEALQMPIDTLIDLAGELSETGLPAEIKIIALQDIYRTDFLQYGEQFLVIITHAQEDETE